MKRYKLVVAYDGSKYCGWQIQPNGITIEEVLNQTLSELMQQPIKVQGASRTDAGVHALGNVAIFDGVTTIPGSRIAYALNQKLPDDIVVMKSEEVPRDWHPRFCQSIKTYEYSIKNAKLPDPTKRYTHLLMSYDLDIEKMKETAKYFVGEHDFANFCRTKGDVKSTIRTIYQLDLAQHQDVITVRVRGNGFLYNMVRMIVGALLLVGRGEYSPEQVKDMLDFPGKEVAKITAPAHGLTLVSIEYLDTLSGDSQ